MPESALRAALLDWGLAGNPAISVECYFAYVHHNVLPYAGGWLDQPVWFRRDYQTLKLVHEYHRRQRGKTNPAELPRMFKD